VRQQPSHHAQPCPTKMNNCCGEATSTWWPWATPAIVSGEEVPAEETLEAAREPTLEEKMAALSGISGRFDASATSAPGVAASKKSARGAPTTKCESDTPLIAATVYMRHGDKAFVLATEEKLGMRSNWPH
jgi:hypothetical protein